MLAVLISALAFTPPPSAHLFDRRRAIVSFAAAAATAPLPAFAQRSSLVPKSSAEATASFKAYQVSKPGVETEAFKEAEKRRLAAADGTKRAKETDAEQIARLGLKTYGEALDNGYDPCATWRGCSRK